MSKNRGGSSKSSSSKPEGAPDGAGSLDKVRDILFGEQSRRSDERMAQLDKRLSEGLSQTDARQDAALAALSQKLDEAVRSLQDAAKAGAGEQAQVAEWHGGTLTDTTASAESVLSAIGHEHFLTYWQPRTGDGFAQALDDLDAALPRLAGMHVFHWLPGDGAGPVQRRPLAEGQGLWPTYLRQAEAGPREADLFAMLEFVCDDDPANLAADAEALRQWTAAVNTAAARR